MDRYPNQTLQSARAEGVRWLMADGVRTEQQANAAAECFLDDLRERRTRASWLEKGLVTATSFLATGVASLGYLPGVSDYETIVSTALATPLAITAGNAVIQKIRKRRDVFSIENLKTLGWSYAGGVVSGSVVGYCWYEALKNFSFPVGF